ncbi:cation diffusion facilitator family transporter [Paenibacillus luteus]|uniref:cation diffusion facilitator family transporter n=1 Tax=Paenibacillus luteus TaxID=2545753 RepID=UPI0011434306|nr:cation diffusion facilitator family transporter [Paenibacillus luteus]
MNAASERQGFIAMLKKGNKSSAIAMIGNAVIAAIKAFAAAFSGSGAMFASAMHSLADAINQGFVFAGSILSEKRPTPRFPTGFGRVINIFCMVAVIVVTIMAYETIREGWHLIQHPVASEGIWLNIGVLLVNLIVDGWILVKAMKEILTETKAEADGFKLVGAAFKNVGRSAPATRLVFYEDIVAVTGALLAMVAVLVVSLTTFEIMDGVVTVLIGLLMVGVAFRVGYDNMIGLIGVSAPKEVADKVSKIIFSEPFVTDIYQLRILQEGRYYHVEALMELKPGLTLADADDIKFKVRDKLLQDSDITDAILGIIEDDGVKSWVPIDKR